MKKENEKIEEIEVIDEVEVVEEEQKVSFFTKVKTGAKKHGKKIAVGAAMITAGVLGYKLGNRDTGVSDDYYIEDLASEDVSVSDENSAE